MIWLLRICLCLKGSGAFSVRKSVSHAVFSERFPMVIFKRRLKELLDSRMAGLNCLMNMALQDDDREDYMTKCYAYNTLQELRMTLIGSYWKED